MSAYYRFLGRGFPVICHPFSDSVRSRWHCEVKGASLSNSALDPDPAVVRLDYPSRNCEPKSCRSLSCPTTGMPKPVEYMWNGVNRNPASGVSNGNLDGIWQHGGAHDDTPPASVNLQALPIKFESTCTIRSPSIITAI